MDRQKEAIDILRRAQDVLCKGSFQLALKVIDSAIALLSEPAETDGKEVPGLDEWLRVVVVPEDECITCGIKPEHVKSPDAIEYIATLADQHKRELAEARKQIEMLTTKEQQQ